MRDRNCPTAQLALFPGNNKILHWHWKPNHRALSFAIAIYGSYQWKWLWGKVLWTQWQWTAITTFTGVTKVKICKNSSFRDCHRITFPLQMKTSNTHLHVGANTWLRRRPPSSLYDLSSHLIAIAHRVVAVVGQVTADGRECSGGGGCYQIGKDLDRWITLESWSFFQGPYKFFSIKSYANLVKQD